MSYFPAKSIAQATRVARSFATLVTRVQLARLSPTTTTTGSFTVPQVGSDVTINVVSSTGFLVGDFVTVGTQVGIYICPVHSSTGPGSLTFTGFMAGGWRAGTSVDSNGMNFIGLGAGGNTVSTGIAGWTQPNGYSATASTSINLANRAAIPSGGKVLVTNHAGTFRVKSVPSGTSLQLTLVRRGDLNPGMTCIQDTSGSPTGATVSQGYPLLTYRDTDPLQFFSPLDAYAMTVSTAASGATIPQISIGCHPNTDTGITAFGQYASGAALTIASSMGVGRYRRVSFTSETDDQHVAMPPNHTLMVRTNIASGTADFTVSVAVRGFFSRN